LGIEGQRIEIGLGLLEVCLSGSPFDVSRGNKRPDRELRECHGGDERFGWQRRVIRSDDEWRREIDLNLIPATTSRSRATALLCHKRCIATKPLKLREFSEENHGETMNPRVDATSTPSESRRASD
jgi:hypothetical protein